MPDMDGFETAELIRLNKDFRHIPIIFVSAISTDSKYIFKGYETGAVDYLPKPFEPEILKSKINVFLALYKQREHLKETTRALSETIEDLKHIDPVMNRLLDNPVYTDLLKSSGNTQEVMLGYSDSCKDGGILASVWNLYQAQQQISAITTKRGIRLNLFHGRGVLCEICEVLS